MSIEQSAWVRDVLPGLGYDRLRLLELRFPPPLPDHESAASQFDTARRALDERRYADCIGACRGIVNMWEKHHGATKELYIAKIVADKQGWAENDVRRTVLDHLWKAVKDVTNAPHHPEGDASPQDTSYREARLVLMLTAALSEHLGALEPR